MSIEAMSQVWALPITPTQKFVLLALADHANDDNVCWPGEASLAIKTGFARSTVNEALKKLTQMELIIRIPLRGKGGFRIGTQYTLALQNGTNLHPDSLHRPNPCRNNPRRPGENPHPDKSIPTSGNQTVIIIEPTKESSNNISKKHTVHNKKEN